MLLKNKKGFLLVDSLISVFVTSLLCIACYSVFNLIIKYDEGFYDYQDKSNEHLLNIFYDTYDCEACIIDESN